MQKREISSYIPFLRQKTGGERDTHGQAKFGTFQGVFRPTILTIVGPLMFLREGWVVGNAGVVGAISMVLLGATVTGITALSISVIVSNTRIGSGGVFSLISQSLGLQVGGSIGIPLFLLQGVAAPMYMYGFAEGWSFLFPEHSSRLVLLCMFAVTGIASYLSAKIAFRLQVVVMIGVVVSISSIFLGTFANDVSFQHAQMWGEFQNGDFWSVFAVYFPTFTGVMVGASMSGNLRDPRRAIPYGTMMAWAISSFVYLLLVFWYAAVATPLELRTNSLISAEKSLLPLAVLIGILCCCASAAISSLVAAPRVMQALAEYEIVPFARFFKKLKNGEPRNASLLTMAISLPLLLFFDGINAIAPLVTQVAVSIFFVINSVLAIEMQLGMISFRPLIRIPRFLPIFGSLLSFMVMFLISPLLGVVALGLVIGVYAYLSVKKISTPWETVQSGLFIALAEWGVKKAVQANTKKNKRNWKPDMLVPVVSDQELEQRIRFAESIASPKGSLRFMVFTKETTNNNALVEKLRKAAMKCSRKGLLASVSAISENRYTTALASSISITKGFFLSPNSVFLMLEDVTTMEFKKTVELVDREKIALVSAVLQPPVQRVFRKRKIALWVRDQTPNWQLSLSLSNLDYAILLAYQLRRNWNAQIEFRCAANTQANIPSIKTYFSELIELARLTEIKIDVRAGSFKQIADEMMAADVNVLGLPNPASKSNLEKTAKTMQSSCIFVKDSGIGLESALV